MLEIQEFRKWLEGKFNVGVANNSRKCPAANYLRTVIPDFYNVGIDEYTVYEGCSVPIPEWMTKFIRKVDMLNRRSVSGQKALELLDQVEKGE